VGIDWYILKLIGIPLSLPARLNKTMSRLKILYYLQISISDDKKNNIPNNLYQA
jgi:hypothetical protein